MTTDPRISSSARATDEGGKASDRAAAGDDSTTDLGLIDGRTLQTRESEIARQRELVSHSSAGATDQGDRDGRQSAQAGCEVKPRRQSAGARITGRLGGTPRWGFLQDCGEFLRLFFIVPSILRCESYDQRVRMQRRLRGRQRRRPVVLRAREPRGAPP